MADLVVIVGVAVFFAVCVWFVRACDRIIGPDPEPAEAMVDVAPPADGAS